MNDYYNFKIYTDGACSGNPGPGGWGCLVAAASTNEQDATVTELGGAEQQTTNNRMELQATIQALNHVKKICVQKKIKTFSVQVFTDSVYVIKGITQWIFGWRQKGWKNSSGVDVINQDLWQDLSQIVDSLQKLSAQKIKWDYVRGHVGIEGNERCDQIAVSFSKHEYIDLFDGLNSDYIFDALVAPASEALPESNFKSGAAKPKTFWYVVLKNGVITRYKTWAECEASVKGAPAVKFKKVTSEAEEFVLLKQWGKA